MYFSYQGLNTATIVKKDFGYTFLSSSNRVVLNLYIKFKVGDPVVFIKGGYFQGGQILRFEPMGSFKHINSVSIMNSLNICLNANGMTATHLGIYNTYRDKPHIGKDLI